MKISKRFFGFLICFFLLFFTPIQNSSQAACGADPNADSVKIAGYAYTSASIQDAYNYASTTLNLPSFTLQLAGQIFTEDLVLDGGAVELDGGWDCSFATKTSPSSVFGTITITSTGSLIATTNTEATRVVSTDQTSFDRDGDGFTSIGSTSGSADDCNDNEFAINPGAIEICDGLDNNCDDQIDEGLTGTDADGDGYYAIGSCGAVADDCNDSNPNINPGALDVPYDGIDQDCSGADLTFANGNACADCHVPDDALGAAHTQRSLPTDSSCVLCHVGPVSSILSGHYGRIVRTTDNGVTAGSTINCWTCHDNNNHSGGPVAGAFGDGLGDVWNDVAPPYPGNYTCDNCHANRAARHATATAHNNRVIDSTCANCHTSDNSVLGSPGSGSLASAADVDALHGVAQATCAICHNYSGSLLDASVVRQTIQNGLNGTQVSCLDCHTDKGTNHGNFEHPIEVGPADLSYNPGQLCSTCHVVANWTEIEGTEHNVATNGAGSCATCHSSPRQIVQNVIADAPNNGGYPIRCLACHADKELTVHGNVDHVVLDYVTGGATYCLDCHDPGTAANATVDVTHSGTCSLCHTTIPALQPGVPAGGGDCVACHIPEINVNWEVIHLTNPPSHASLVQVAATSCGNCHDNTLFSAAAETHDGCVSCHDADNGTLVAINGTNSQDFITGGDCTTCHGSNWGGVHTIAPDHSSLVTTAGTNNCASCHADALIDASTHLTDCSNCHSTTDGSLQSSAVGKDFIFGGNCETCHTTGFDSIHATSHTHTVAQGADDLSFEAPGTPCSDCHVVATWTEIEGTEHNVSTNGAGSCATCHNSTRQEVMDAITAGANPTNCLACHSNKELAVHGSIDHVASGDVTLATACADCHDPGTAVNATVEITHGANCALCHTTVPDLQPGVSPGPADCATCHSAAWNVTHLAATPDHSNLIKSTGTSCAICHNNTLVSAAPNTHLENCSNCHSTTDGSLQSSAVGKNFTTGGDCTTCHGNSWGTLHGTAPDHSSLVTTTGTDNCASCHADALIDASTHQADCSNCHSTADGSLQSTAVGKDFTIGGNCETCHTSGWGTTHTTNTPDHSNLVKSTGTSCASCHDNTLVSAAPDSHLENCSNCHSTNGTLQSTAVGKNFTTGGDCTTCHGTDWGGLHTTAPDHSGIVTVASTSCASCHDNTLVSASAKTHNACFSCHSATTGELISLAINKSAPGDCTSCHTDSWNAIHNGHSHAVSLGAGDQSSGTSCGVCHVVATWGQINGTEHNVVTNGPSSCETCHNSPRLEVIDAIAQGANPTNCLNCHSANAAAHGSVDHVATGYVTLTSPCNDCHDPGSAENATVDITHSGNCSLCHTTVPALQPGVPADGGTCATCHTGDVQTAHTNCTACHGEPPSGTAAPNRDSAHSEHDLLGYGSVTPSCNACHNSATHYNSITEVIIPSNFDDMDSGSPSFNGSTCSNTRCHGGQTTPSWSTGSLNVNTQCRSCHNDRERGSNQYNDYGQQPRGEHDVHVRGADIACTECHSVAKLAAGSGGNAHFSNLQTTTFELSPGLTIGGTDTSVPASGWNDSTNRCSNFTCHGEGHNYSWFGN